MEQLEPLHCMGTEDKDGAGDRFLVKLALDQRRHAVVALAEVDGAGRQHDPRKARSATTRSTIRVMGVCESSRGVDWPDDEVDRKGCFLPNFSASY